MSPMTCLTASLELKNSCTCLQERSRPSFVAMQQSKGSTRRGMRSRSPGSRARKSSLDLSFYHESAGAMVTTGENIDGNESPGSD